MSAFSKHNMKAVALQYVPMMFGLRIPGFIRIHGRYARRSLLTWFVLFIAPFVIGVASLSVICERILKVDATEWQLFLIALFLIAVAFFFAERYRTFRRIYVMAIPALVIVNGGVHLIFTNGLSTGSVITFGILAVLPAWWLGRHAMGKGYRLLSDGADKDYRPGRDLYMDGQYEEAFAYLEPSAKRGHMKSLYLLGHACEHGNGRERERVKAARFYDKASRKGYRKAQPAFEGLFETFSQDETDAFETKFSRSGINDLF